MCASCALSLPLSLPLTHSPLPLPTQYGGVLHIRDGEATLTSCTLYGNSASQVSGGVCLLFSLSLPLCLRLTHAPPLPLPTQAGGAIYIAGSSARFSLDGATQILGNSATDRGNSIFHVSGTINFTSCQPGHYITPEDEGRTHEENITGCVRACPAGTHAAGTARRVGEDACAPCDAGFYCPGGDVSPAPLPCPAGRYASDTGQPLLRSATRDPSAEGSANSTAHLCPPGKYSGRAGNSEPSNCTECEAGFYCPPPGSAQQGNFYLRPCDPGTFSPSRKASACIPCHAGKVSRSGEESCTACPAGRFNNSKQDDCESCPAGRWSAAVAAASGNVCTACGEGKYSRGVGADSEDACVACPPGKAHIMKIPGAFNASFCVTCLRDTYQDKPGRTACKPCNTTATSNGGATICTECAAGTYMNATKHCAPCPSGFVRSTARRNAKPAEREPTPMRRHIMQCASQASTVSRRSNVACEDCPSGTALRPGSVPKICARCAPGKGPFAVFLGL